MSEKFQRFTSRETSINKTKLPAIYRKLGRKIGGVVLDYGCGRYTEHIREHLESMQCMPYFYDPYNLPKEENLKAWNRHKVGAYDTVICSNVLNVIDSDWEVNNVIHRLAFWGKHVYITVYEGDKTGKGRQTGADQWQRNEKAREYLNRIRALGYKARMEHGTIHMEGLA